jgi:hypothetical protein
MLRLTEDLVLLSALSDWQRDSPATGCIGLVARLASLAG